MQTRLDAVASALPAATAGAPRPPAHESGVTQLSNMGADMTFLDKQRWEGKIFDGTWHTADGGVRPVIEPATGDKAGHRRVRCPQRSGALGAPGTRGPGGLGRGALQGT